MFSSLRSRLFTRQPAYVQDLNSFPASQGEGYASADWVTTITFPLDPNLANYSNLPAALNHPYTSLRLDPWPSTVKARSLSVIKKAAIIGHEFIVLPSGAYLVEPIWHHSLLTEHPAYFDALYCKKVKRLEGNFFLVPLYWFNNYYHWNAQVLPRLYRVLPNLPQNCLFIIPDTLESWQIESLALLGIDHHQLLKKPAREKWILQNLFYAAPCAPSSGHTAESMNWVRDTIKDNIATASTGLNDDMYSPYIYVTRGQASRQISNESTYVSSLEDLGFSIIDAAQFSYLQQIQLFSRCRFLCGPHGAGMVNMLWTQEECRVFEIQSNRLLDRGCFWDLAQNLEHSYSFYLASSDSDGFSPAPLHVDHPADLIDCIAAALDD